MKKLVNKTPSLFHRKGEAIVPGDVFENQLTLTLDPSLFLLWSCFVPSFRQADTNKLFWEDLGYASQIIPYSFLYNLALSFGVFGLTEYSSKHISIEDTSYLKPSYAGDTLTAKIFIASATKNDDGSFSVKTVHFLLNQKGKPVFRLIKNSIFPKEIPIKEGNAKCPIDYENSSTFVNHILSGCTSTQYPPFAKFDVEKNQFYIHEMVRTMAPCENTFIATLLKNMHPLAINPLINEEKSAYLPEGHIVAIVQAITALEFLEFICPEIEKATQYKEVKTTSSLSSFSYVMGKEDAEYGFEEVYIRTFGLDEIDPLSTINISELPDGLSENIETKNDLKNILTGKNSFLFDHICLIMDWKFYRLKQKGSGSFII
ncbi:MAG: hypothetical protein ACEPOW_06590 [Bacteroidales bacterium]